MTTIAAPEMQEAGFSESFELTAEPSRLEKNKGNREKFLTHSQSIGLLKLQERAKLFARIGRIPQGGFSPKLFSMCIGPTGTGKTELARRLAANLGWKLQVIDCGSYIVTGAYTRPSTLQIIRDWVRTIPEEKSELKRRYGILCLDEICKALPRGNALGAWSYSVWSEIISICDADTRLLAHGWQEKDLERFRNRVFLIASGAFQNFYNSVQANRYKGTLGFKTWSQSDPKTEFSNGLIDSGEIQEELLTRFASDHIVLDPPTRQDLSKAIGRIHATLDIPLIGNLDDLLDQAEENRSGVRWIENYLSKLCLSNMDKVAAMEEAELEDKKVELDLTTSDFWHHLRRSNDSCGTLRVTLGKLWGEFQKQDIHLRHYSESRFREFLFGAEPHTASDIIFSALRRCKPAFDSEGLCSMEVGNQAIHLWCAKAWNGIQYHSGDLAKVGLLPTWMRAWEAAVSIMETRQHLHESVETGKVS